MCNSVCGGLWSFSRRVGVDKAISAKNQLIKWESMNFIAYSEPTRKRRGEAGIGCRIKVEGMDAIVA